MNFNIRWIFQFEQGWTLVNEKLYGIYKLNIVLEVVVTQILQNSVENIKGGFNTNSSFFLILQKSWVCYFRLEKSR